MKEVFVSWSIIDKKPLSHLSNSSSLIQKLILKQNFDQDNHLKIDDKEWWHDHDKNLWLWMSGGSSKDT